MKPAGCQESPPGRISDGEIPIPHGHDWTIHVGDNPGYLFQLGIALTPSVVTHRRQRMHGQCMQGVAVAEQTGFDSGKSRDVVDDEGFDGPATEQSEAQLMGG